jgi:transcriptional regulator with XRE-family HTH domain
MDTVELIEIRKTIGVSQAGMAKLLGCATSSYKRYELGTRDIPTYIAMSAKMLAFLHSNSLLKKFELSLKNDLS